MTASQRREMNDLLRERKNELKLAAEEQANLVQHTRELDDLTNLLKAANTSYAKSHIREALIDTRSQLMGAREDARYGAKDLAAVNKKIERLKKEIATGK